MSAYPAAQFELFYIRYNRLIAAGFILIFLFCCLWEYNRHKKHEMSQAASALETSAARLEGELRRAESHVLQLRILAEEFMADRNRNKQRLPEFDRIQNAADGSFFSMDSRPPEYTGSYGNLFGPGVFEGRTPGFYREINAALWISDLMKSAHSASPAFSRSFYLSENKFAVVYPWMDTDYVIGRAAGQTIGEVFDEFYNSSEWTSMRSAAAGESGLWIEFDLEKTRGLTATNVAPVMAEGRIKGIITAVITLPAAGEILERSGPVDGSRIYLTDGKKAVAKTTGGGEDDLAVFALDEVLPAGIPPGVRTGGAVNPPAAFPPGGENTISATLEGTDWSIVSVIPEKKLLAAFLPHAACIAGVFAGLFATIYLISLKIKPIFKTPSEIVDIIEKETSVNGRRASSDYSTFLARWKRFITRALRFESAAANLPGAVIQMEMRDGSGIRVLFATDSICAMLDAGSIDELTADEGEFGFIPHKERKVFQEKIYKSAHEMDTFDHICLIEKNSGESKYIRFIARPRESGRDRITWDGLVLDITDNIEKQQELKALQMKLEELVEEKTRELKSANREIEIANRREKE